MADNFKWNGKELERLVVVHIGKNMSAACLVLVNHLKDLVNVEGTGRAIKAHTTRYGREKKRYKKKHLIYNFAPSDPDEPPRKQTGRLLASITYEVKGLVSRVGTNIRYGRWLELGTKRMKARPWLRRGLYEMRAAIAKLIGRPM